MQQEVLSVRKGGNWKIWKTPDCTGWLIYIQTWLC